MVTRGRFSRVQFLLTQVQVCHEREREPSPVLWTTSDCAEGVTRVVLLLDLPPLKRQGFPHIWGVCVQLKVPITTQLVSRGFPLQLAHPTTLSATFTPTRAWRVASHQLRTPPPTQPTNPQA